MRVKTWKSIQNINLDNVVYLDKNSLVIKKQDLNIDFVTCASAVIENAFTLSESIMNNENGLIEQ